jgi:tyrosyl-tRNA synthetase
MRTRKKVNKKMRKKGGIGIPLGAMVPRNYSAANEMKYQADKNKYIELMKKNIVEDKCVPIRMHPTTREQYTSTNSSNSTYDNLQNDKTIYDDLLKNCKKYRLFSFMKPGYCKYIDKPCDVPYEEKKVNDDKEEHDEKEDDEEETESFFNRQLNFNKGDYDELNKQGFSEFSGGISKRKRTHKKYKRRTNRKKHRHH